MTNHESPYETSDSGSVKDTITVPPTVVSPLFVQFETRLSKAAAEASPVACEYDAYPQSEIRAPLTISQEVHPPVVF